MGWVQAQTRTRPLVTQTSSLRARNPGPIPFPESFSTVTTFQHPSMTNAMSRTPTATTSTSNYQAIFDTALEAYKKKTKKDLRSHPLLSKLQTCNSPDAVLAVLREQIPVFDQSHSSTNDRLTKWLNPTVNVLYAFSEAIGAGIGLVSIRAFEVYQFNCSSSDLRPCTGIPTRGSDLHRDRCSAVSEYLLDPIASTTRTPTL